MGEPWPQIIKVISAAYGVAVGYLFGGWDVLIHLLLILIIVDWMTGWAAAWMRGELKSRTGFKGIIRKVVIFVIVAVAHFIDQALGSLRYFQDAVVFFYLANELLSVIENVGKMGVPMPDILRNAVHIFESKSKPMQNPNLIEEAQPEAVKEQNEQTVQTEQKEHEESLSLDEQDTSQFTTESTEQSSRSHKADSSH